MSDYSCELFATCLAGLEHALADELAAIGIRRTRPLQGGVACYCDRRLALKACLWSRLAARVLLVVGHVNAANADALYQAVFGLPWEEVVATEATLSVRASGANDELRNTKFTALKVKDAVCDALRERAGWRPDIDPREADAVVEVRLKDDRATVSLDLSGSTLYRRSYVAAEDGADEAHRCGQAAGLLALAGWNGRATEGWALVDPACDKGALVVEAASVACSLAPGLTRDRWGFGGWAQLDLDAWESLIDEADAAFEAGLQRVREGVPKTGGATGAEQVRFIGLSASSVAIAEARRRVRRAGLRDVASIELGDAESVDEAVVRASKTAGGPCLVASVEALSAPGDAQATAQAAASALVRGASAAPEGSSLAVVGYDQVGRSFPQPPACKAALGRGRVEQTARVFDEPAGERTTVVVPDPAGGAEHEVSVYDATAAQFVARLHKNFKQRRKWARRVGVSCYRVYDADLPEYAVAIDVYAGADHASGNTYLHIAEYAPPASVDADKAARRFDDVLALAPVAMGVRPDHVFAKTRRRDKGGSQYASDKRYNYVTLVEEAGHLFEVDLSGYLDTGLFLDHRVTRLWLQDNAQGARFLNLFAYTGSGTVYAAAGGAAETTTVDLSQTYLDWARRNMELNGFSGPKHAFERADAMAWITECRHSPRRFDLVFVDPPTFSNSKAMGKRTWDVQRDHAELLIGVSRLLAPGGVALFSCNLRTFKPDLETLAKYGVDIQDVTAETIPDDFSRNQRVHKAYLVRRAQKG